MAKYTISTCSRCLEICDIEREMEPLGMWLDAIGDIEEGGVSDSEAAIRYADLGERLAGLLEIDCSCGIIEVGGIE